MSSPDDLLRFAFECGNLNEFHIALENFENSQGEGWSLNELELFGEVLSTPNSGNFIQLFFEHGARFYQPSSVGLYPIQFAIKSHCVENVTVLLTTAMHQKNEIKFAQVLNTKLYGRNNFLHTLISELTDENFEEVSGVIKILIRSGCNPNLVNVENATPFSQLLFSFVSPESKKHLINFVLENSDVNLRLCSKKVLILNGLQTFDVYKKNDYEYLMQQLSDENESEFLNNFSQFKSQENFHQACSSFLEIAVEKNMLRIVEMVVNSGVDINVVPNLSRWGKEPAFLAANLGRKEIFLRFLQLKDLLFESQVRQKNILHEILSSHEIDAVDAQELFKLIIMDKRFSTEIINNEDAEGRSALFYACQFGYDDIVKQLLKRGAYVGSSGVIGIIKFHILESLLDESLTKKVDSFKEEKIFIDYQFLLPPHKEHKKKVVPKVEALKNIAKNPKLCSLLKHPVLMSFLDLKWSATKRTILFTSIMHFFCLAFLVWTMSYFLKHALDFTENEQVLIVTIFVSIFLSMILLEVYEIVTSLKTYFFKLGNWLDLLMIGTIIFAAINGNAETPDTLLADLQKAGAFLILFVAGQCIKIVGDSIYTTIFRKVCATFFKLIVMYSFLLITFALSFHILFNAEEVYHHEKDMLEQRVAKNESGYDNETMSNESDGSSDYLDMGNYNFTDEDPSENEIRRKFIAEDNTYKHFGNVYISLYRVIAMFAGELNSDQFVNPLKMALMIFFIFFITITLQNLMNSMAIIDTQQIISEAEIIGLKKRVAVVYSYETFFAMLFKDWFKTFSTKTRNKYVLNLKEGRSLTHYDPTKLYEQSSKLKKPPKLKLSESAVDTINDFFEKRENDQLSTTTTMCSKCSARASEENISDTKL